MLIDSGTGSEDDSESVRCRLVHALQRIECGLRCEGAFESCRARPAIPQVPALCGREQTLVLQQRCTGPECIRNRGLSHRCDADAEQWLCIQVGEIVILGANSQVSISVANIRG